MKRGLITALLLWALHAQAADRVVIGMQLEPFRDSVRQCV